MTCNTNALLAVLPQRLRGAEFSDVLEVRLRIGRAPCLVTMHGIRTIEGPVREEELRYVVSAASRYSPWAAASMAQGYLTAPGGHRIGICGTGAGETVTELSSLCIRVARDIRGPARGLPKGESLLILGPPGSGKTTLLRDHIRRISRHEQVSVVDERGELFPRDFDRGEHTDVLIGVSKARGIDMVLRSMGPTVIAMDEVTCPEDCAALVRAARCGVRLLATAHAGSVRDLRERTVYRPILETGLFDRAAVLGQDRQWRLEEVGAW